MRKTLLTMLAAVALAACGGGDDDTFKNPASPGTGGGGVAPSVAAISVTSSSPTILSDGSTTAEITALVRDENNNLLPGIAVSFTASSGGLAVTQATTDETGAAKATLSTAGDPTLRTITVTASAGSASASTTVSVVDPPPGPTAAQMTLITSTPTIPSDGTVGAEITAIVRNSSNQFVENVPVQFTTTSGGLQVTQGTTDASGVAKAVLTAAGDPSNRTITVTAVSGTVTQAVDVTVTGTTLALQGPSSLAVGQTAQYTVVLADSGSNGIANRQITVTSAQGNQISPATITTDSSGQASFNLTVNAAANDTLTASALGASATRAVAVNSDSFSFVSPASNTEVPLNTPQSVTVRWSQGGGPVAGQTVNFTTTRGTVTPTSGTTNGNGEVTVQVSSTNAGFATITATAASGSTAQLPLEFVATTAASIEVQANTFSIAPNEQATITAVVRDAANNLVKHKVVTFTLQDVSGGTLSVGAAETDSNGRAQTIYTAGSSTSAQNGVVITATVQDTPSVTDSVSLTVAKRQAFISIGTGNTIEEPNSAQYKMDYIIQVTDANGSGVANVPLSVSALSVRYLKGFRTPVDGGWATCYTTVPNTLTPSDPGADPVVCNTVSIGGCFDEDTNRNGVLDPGEDLNNSGLIEAGNIAAVAPSNVVTDSNGFATVSVYYPQEYAYWLWVTIEARALVQGTEFGRQQTFLLPGSSTDFNNEDVAPPGVFSPFGMSTSCTDTD